MNKKMNTWLPVKIESDFSVHNLPFGIFKTKKHPPRAGVAIGGYVLDLSALFKSGLLKNIAIKENVFDRMFLNDFIALGKNTAREARNRLQELLKKDNPALRDNHALKEKILHEIKDVTLLLPVKPGDYTDFYSSLEHATNVGAMFRDPKNPLLPNWRWMPIGYHGRSSSIIISGTPIHRPKGQIKLSENNPPVFAPSRALDFELEMAFITTNGKPLGQAISTNEAENYIWGMAMFNDWSARDIQKWEYQPLGPFLGKSFASSMSPWIVTLDALEPFRVKNPVQDPPPLPYLQYQGDRSFDINLEVFIQPENGQPHRVSRTNFKYLYWNMCQQVAHQTSNGCPVIAGDLYASGTISGSAPDSFGSMLELTWGGSKPIRIPDGSERKFINDGDSVIMNGFSEKNNVRVGFGELKSLVLPAQ